MPLDSFYYMNNGHERQFSIMKNYLPRNFGYSISKQAGVNKINIILNLSENKRLTDLLHFIYKKLYNQSFFRFPKPTSHFYDRSSLIPKD